MIHCLPDTHTVSIKKCPPFMVKIKCNSAQYA